MFKWIRNSYKNITFLILGSSFALLTLDTLVKNQYIWKKTPTFWHNLNGISPSCYVSSHIILYIPYIIISNGSSPQKSGDSQYIYNIKAPNDCVYC